MSRTNVFLIAAIIMVIATIGVMMARTMNADPFTDATLQSAKASAQADDIFVLIDFTATWCGPCKRMDVETWPDAKVVEWISANAIAVQIDVDQHPTIAQQYNITAMPTIVLERNDVIIDRVVGYHSPAALIEWLDNTQQ